MEKKLNFLEVVCVALLVNAIHWHVTSSFTVGPQSSIGSEEITTATIGLDVCAGYSCPENKYCVVNETNNRPQCVCIEFCEEPDAPVCGNDGLTYGNECSLRAFACMFNFNIAVANPGRCSERPVDCAGGFDCPYFTVCVMNEANQMPDCVCNEDCDDSYDPYCGSDGNDYRNGCFVYLAECKDGVTVQHRGSCKDGPTTPVPNEETTTTTAPDVCVGYSCPTDKQCVVNETTNRPECVCNEICFLLFAPVCGSDGIDYGNNCFLKVAACKANTVINVQHQGSCSDVTATTPSAQSTTKRRRPWWPKCKRGKHGKRRYKDNGV